MSEKVCVGCTRIRSSSSAEKLVFCSDQIRGEVSALEAPVLHNDNDSLATDVISAPCVEFSPVCPLDSCFQTVVIQNFRFDVQYRGIVAWYH